MNKITGRELDPNQFPAWAEFTPSGESLTKVSARDGFQIDLGNPLTLEDLTLASLGVSGLTTLHDLDIKDASETVILQRNGSTIETLIDTVSGGVTTKAMARIGAGIIESGGNDTNGYWIKYGNGMMEQWGWVDVPGQAINTSARGRRDWPGGAFVTITDYQFAVSHEVGNGSAAMIGLQNYNGIWPEYSLTYMGVVTYSYRAATTNGTDVVRYRCHAWGTWK